jgi:membrane protease YdiL (CAAX protease family)
MGTLKKVFSFVNEYKLETKQFKKIDLVLSILLYTSVLIIYYFMGQIFVSEKISLTEEFLFIVTGIVSLIIIGIVFAFCLLRRQKLSSIGFCTKKLKQSLISGLVVAVIVIIIFSIVNIITEESIRKDIPFIIQRFFYYLIFIAFVEELVFRGYIGTRLYGCLKNKFLAVTITGVLFVFMHSPFQMVMSNMTILEYLSNSWANLIFIFFLHFFMQLLYAKYNSLIAPTIFHFVWDYVQWL